MRCVIDTNVFVSAIMSSSSVPRQAVNRSLNEGIVLFSEATIDELKEVLFRSKFGRYVSHEDRVLFLSQVESAVEFVPIIHGVRECRDPRDDKFLEVALSGRADVIIRGDEDLLAMNPWRGIAIVSPKDYLILEV
ncbi:MAG: putative toxin-antitoxin system toxin component, PIN family [Anaerolineales bacterium]